MSSHVSSPIRYRTVSLRQLSMTGSSVVRPSFHARLCAAFIKKICLASSLESIVWKLPHEPLSHCLFASCRYHFEVWTAFMPATAGVSFKNSFFNMYWGTGLATVAERQLMTACKLSNKQVSPVKTDIYSIVPQSNFKANVCFSFCAKQPGSQEQCAQGTPRGGV